MPTYDYECTECDHRFEEFLPMRKADKFKVCPECLKMTAERQIGCGGGIIFKGAGFYQTEYRSREYIAEKQHDNRQARKAERCGQKSVMK